MNRIKIILLLSVIFCLAAGCQNKKVNDDKDQHYHRYYINKEEDQVVEKSYSPKSSKTMDMVKEFQDLLSEKSDSGEYRKLLPKKVTIEKETWDEGILTLDMSSAYQTQSNTREILTRVGLVRTFVQIPGVVKVQITVNGNPIKDIQGRDIGLMNSDSFSENSGKNINTYQNVMLTLYFSDKTGKKLVPEERKVYFNSNVPLERVVVEQLVKGPKDENHLSVLPSDTRVLSVATSEGICYVNLDKSFQGDPPTATEEVSIYSIVNSLHKNCKVQEVQFSINGESKVKFRDKVPLDQLFKEDQSYISEEEK
ncbi:GerMN domain-containing protein [Blautia liquoris]|uniref:GerMN domain-containing protein n=1 Tax=Blautia liquoris TaxID=2779518 RepID=A0A7M2RDI0_9FIRM|nr:GerMN domain-containing protein [Blautia liquoris]QOV18346.1 GerMN domain-containing protein [Blautia liquoris]